MYTHRSYYMLTTVIRAYERIISLVDILPETKTGGQLWIVLAGFGRSGLDNEHASKFFFSNLHL